MQVIQETLFQSLGQEDPLEKEMATCSSILAWKIPRTEEPGRLWSMRSLRVGHDRTHCHNNRLQRVRRYFGKHRKLVFSSRQEKYLSHNYTKKQIAIFLLLIKML